MLRGERMKHREAESEVGRPGRRQGGRKRLVLQVGRYPDAIVLNGDHDVAIVTTGAHVDPAASRNRLRRVLDRVDQRPDEGDGCLDEKGLRRRLEPKLDWRAVLKG